MRILERVLRLALACVAASITWQASARPAAPTDLLVNGLSNPLAIDRNATRFTWRSMDGGRGEAQTAYQIIVASSPVRLGEGTGDFWNSGRVDSATSASIDYKGRVLPAAARLWWEVRTWNQTGKASPYSTPASFDTGLNEDEWTARYLWDGTTNQNNFAYFRKTFVITNRPARAKVYITAHNDYLLYCNGQPLGRGPARCDPDHYGQYNAYDVTPLLKTGTNVFAAMAHWSGNWHNCVGNNAHPAFLLEARLDYPDGSTSIIGTDESWKVLAHTAFIETNVTYFGSGSLNRAAIQFDSRREPAGWQTVDFDDSSWASATVVDRSDYHLFAQMAPLEQEQAELKPVSILQTNGAWLVDFGRCLDGWPKLTMRANQPGDTVRVEYFQMSGGRKPSGWDQYICHGGTETWDADFGRHTSFQVFKITGYAGRLRAADVRGMWAYCDADVAGRFQCSSPLLNSIYEMCERSARQNIQQGVISVDADREQSPWLADAWNIAGVLLYNDRGTMMIDKVIRDYAGGQFPDGYIPACCPGHRIADADPSRRIPEWAMYWPMLLWEQYLFSGDQSLLREMAPNLSRLLEWLKPFQDPTTKLLNPVTKWRISDYVGGNMPNGGYNAATACQYYDNLRIAARIFSVLGQTNQSEDYLRQAEEVKAGINASLFNGEFYLARTDRKEMFPLASAWALRFDIEPAADKSKILAVMEKAGKPNIGGYGGDAFYSGILNAGGGDFAVRDLARYRPMLEENRANWEGFRAGPNTEVNHAWTAYPAYIFLKYICGIQPTSGGFATFDVRPETGGLTFAEGTVPTVKGPITTHWEKSAGGRFDLSVTVPPNTRASIHIPKLSNGNVTITESGKGLWPSTSEVNDAGVLSVSEEDTSINCFVSAGDYQFREIPADVK
jgi:alpha-L-rhamnosidase